MLQDIWHDPEDIVASFALTLPYNLSWPLNFNAPFFTNSAGHDNSM